MIGIRDRTNEDVEKLSDYINKDKASPGREGRLLVTRYDVYYIKNGQVEWEGAKINSPINRYDKLYVASGDYIFCADPEGPVYWKKKISNDGELKFKGRNLVVKSKGKEIKLDPDTGRSL